MKIQPKLAKCLPKQKGNAASPQKQHPRVCLYIHVFSFPEAVISCLTVICFLYKVYRRYIGSKYVQIKLSTETSRGKSHTALKLRKALSPTPEPSQQAGIKVLQYMNFPHYMADRSRNIGTAFNKPKCIVKESDSTLEQLRQYLLKELELNGVLEKLPHDSRAVGHKRFLTKSDGFTL